jgi:hypothetical protein
MAEPPPDWEPALSAARAILAAYDHGVLVIEAPYLADTLRMVLDAMTKTQPET